jgi:1-acyl-sn-glycerol-3-phosphate acyltransferase
MLQLFRRLLLVCLFRPFAKLIIGMDVHGRTNLPEDGPAIVAANHNSHIDTLLLLCLFPSRLLPRLRPMAAADHFLKSPLSSWVSLNIIGILPVVRERIGRNSDVLGESKAALQRGEILLIFPEGTRGEAEEMGPLKAGIARLAEACPEAPVIPVYLQGAGRVLPRKSRILVPFNCSAIVGSPLRWLGDRPAFMAQLRAALEELRSDAPPLRWL